MKFISKSIFILIFVNIWGAMGYASDDKEEILLGIISQGDLQKEPYSTWYNDSEKKYQVDNDALANIDALLEGVEIKIVLGTWCHDSQREVPRFYKILNDHEAQTEMIALDRKKQAPNNELQGIEITHTPTFIFYKNGQELNRIVERPIESLEKDMVKILKGENYIHSKLIMTKK